MDEPTDTMWQALVAFRARHGVTWRAALGKLWASGGDAREPDGATLRAIRNRFDPGWPYALGEAELDAAERRLRLAATLPAMCATTLPSTHEPIVLKRGESGHWPLPDGMTIERINAIFHATPPQVAAMLVGSMFGWEVPGADPSRYDAKGQPLRR